MKQILQNIIIFENLFKFSYRMLNSYLVENIKGNLNRDSLILSDIVDLMIYKNK